jgi:hypothetical protein
MRKVSDWLAEAKIPRAERDAVAVLEDATGAVFFVEGLRPSDALRAGPNAAWFCWSGNEASWRGVDE